MSPKTIIVVPWHNPHQLTAFEKAWGLNNRAPSTTIIFQQDKDGSGCALTKNRGIAAAIERSAEIVVILDDDCFPSDSCRSLDDLAHQHRVALEPVEWSPQFAVVTDPPSRGTPYNLPKTMPVACSMGFWLGVGDYDAPRQLVRGATTPMKFERRAIFGQMFPLSGMNIAFKPRDWMPYCQFVDVPRWDDIWMGWIWMKEAYRRGYCFNLQGPTVKHSRQSNVWQNLRDEAKYLEQNETLWQKIASHDKCDYESLRKLLPV